MIKRCATCTHPNLMARPGLEYYLYCPEKGKEIAKSDKACDSHNAPVIVPIKRQRGWVMPVRVYSRGLLISEKVIGQ